MTRWIHIFAGTILVLFGLSLFLYPCITTKLLEYESQKTIQKFEEECKRPPVKEELPSDQTPDGPPTPDPLWEELCNYNRELYLSGQAEYRDEISVAQAPDLASKLPGGCMGSIAIPDMEVLMPLFLGASTENMAAGAAVLGGTSLPLGGINTNCVIAGHRGYRGAPYFRDIEVLRVGSYVYITNPWGQLRYRVAEARIVSPTSSEELRIRPGQDMITLLTCHPYAGHGKYRYVVFCCRDEESPEVPVYGDYVISQITEEDFQPSEDRIQGEMNLRWVGSGLILLMVLILWMKGKKR